MRALAVGDVPAPHIEYGQIAPILIVLGVACACVLVEAFVPRAQRYAAQVWMSLAGLAVAFGWTFYIGVYHLKIFGSTIWEHAPHHHKAAMEALGVDGPTLFIQGTILILALLSLLLIAERYPEPSPFAAQAGAVPGSPEEREGLVAGLRQTEVFPLMLFAVGGMLIFPAANDLLTMFVGLEVLSLPLYILCGLARRRRLLSQEAAVKYFLLGAFSSAFFLYGTALLYGYSGSVRLPEISAAISKGGGNETLLLCGIALLGVGLLFKMGAAPFQAWKPDVYQGAPTPITALMASCVVVSAVGAVLRVFYLGLETARWDWRPMMWGVAILTMIVGAVVAITQTDVKRMLAYSSIAHGGFLLTGVVATNQAGLSGTLFYLAAYGFTTVGAFAVITMVRDPGGEADHLSRWAGLGKRQPLVAGTFAFFLLAFAGIPLTSGFTGKYAVFQAAISGGATPLVIVGVISSAIAAFFYVRVIVLMFFNDPTAEGPTVAFSPPTVTAVGIGALATVVLGVVPGPVLHLTQVAANQLFVR